VARIREQSVVLPPLNSEPQGPIRLTFLERGGRLVLIRILPPVSDSANSCVCRIILFSFRRMSSAGRCAVERQAA